MIKTSIKAHVTERVRLKKMTTNDDTKHKIKHYLSLFGYDKITSTEALKNITCNLSTSVKSTSPEWIEGIILKIICNNLESISKNDKFINTVEAMKIKMKNLSCESVLKLILYCDTTQKIIQIHNALYSIIENNHNPDISAHNIKKIYGYILCLNLNKFNYTDILAFSCKDKFKQTDDIKKMSNSYYHFAKIDSLAKTHPDYSAIRRTILQKSGLLTTQLQRDPDEVAQYDEQMISSREDKRALLADLNQSNSVTIVDIGPAGGATFKDVAEMANQTTSYIGIELDDNELLSLNKLMIEYLENDHHTHNKLNSCQFVLGNALELKKILDDLKLHGDVNNNFISIILSSVIHEIYSYCSFQRSSSLNKNGLFSSITTMSPTTSDSRYNLESVYHLYLEALKSIKDNPSGGALNIRDGVMYHQPDELVTIKINDDSWLTMFKSFISDTKYNHLSSKLNIANIHIGEEIQLEAKYAQEFMLKANWGAESFGNEINEIYCYLTRDDQIKILNAVADELGMKIDIESREYTQQGYKDHITKDKIEVINGFGKNKFPPTNMIIRVRGKERAMTPQ